MTILELEKLRKSAKFFLILDIAMVVLAVPFWPSLFSIVMCVMGAVLFFTLVMKKMSDYKRIFKENIVKASLEGVFTELCYDPDKGVSAQEVELSGLVELKDEFVSNDLMVAKYGKVNFKQADIVISDRSKIAGTDGIPSEVTTKCFIGRFLVFDFLKPTVAPVKVMGKNFNPEGGNQGVFNTIKKKLISDKSEQQVLLESEVFNENFNTFCSDPQTAFYILTPQIVEAISMLSNHYQGKIALSFRDKKMFVVISSKKDSLEPKLLSNHTIWKEKELVTRDIQVITDFIQLMNLENNMLVVANR